jgi:hypothetical protein
MRKNLLSVFTALAAVILFSSVDFAQNKTADSAVRDLYVISAKAGGVNFVEGKVSNVRAKGRSGLLLKNDTVEVGDKVSTGADGKAEILLNPGSYIRLAENTNFAFAATSLDDLELNLSSGSAVIETITSDEFKVAVNTPKGRFFIVKSGVYRIDIANDGTGRIAVLKGKALLDNFDATEIKAGRAAMLDGGQVEIVKFDRDDKDALEIWSKARAKELAKVNSRLVDRNLRNSLISSYINGRSWNIYDSYGLWVRDSFSSNYCFLPFGYGWSSPYGYGFGRDFWRYRLPGYFYQPPTNNVIVRNTGGIVPTVTALPRRGRTERDFNDDAPPFQRIQRGIRTPSADENSDFSPTFSSPGRSAAPAPVYSAPMRAPSSRGSKIEDQ